VPSSKGRRWKLLGLSVVTILALASSAYVYWRINAPPSSTLCVTATSPPFEFRMELDKKEFQLSETVAIRMSLKNIDEKPVRIAFSNENFIFGFEVKDENDTRVFLRPVWLRPAIEDVILQPSDQLNETLEWSQEASQGSAYGQSFEVGAYKIIGRTGTFYLAEGNWNETSTFGDISWGPLPQIETPSIAITVTPPPHVTATYPPLELHMNLSKTAYQQNETIVVSLSLTNKGSEPVALGFAYQNDIVGFIVKDENDTEVFVHPLIHLHLTYHIVLEPGEQITSHSGYPTEWYQRGNVGKYDGTKLVSPGTYKIIGRTGYFGMVGQPGPESGRVETPSVTIVIG
jgi:hypothetical protein